MALTFTFTLMPFGVLAVSSVLLAMERITALALVAFLLSAIGVLALLVTMRRLFILCRGNPWYLIFHPAMIRGLGLCGVTWRGTTYKGGKVVSPGSKL